MEKYTFSFADFLVGAIVKFKEIDLVDISLLLSILKKEYSVFLCEETFFHPNILFCGGKYMPKGDTLEEKEASLSILEKEVNHEVKSFFERLSMHELILRKIATIGRLQRDSISRFGVTQASCINSLLQEGFLCYPTEDPRDIILTPEANMKLFLTDYAEEVKAFKCVLSSKGYNVIFFPLFLLSQDFSKSAQEILTVENFIANCNAYGRSVFKEQISLALEEETFGLKNTFPKIE